MLYEVFIPSTESEGYDVTITVEAKNWIVALRSGLDRTGENDTDIRGVMCDIKEDNSIHVTDAMTRRVFVLREMEPEFDMNEPAPPLETDTPIQGPPKSTVDAAPVKVDTPVLPEVSPNAATMKLDAVTGPPLAVEVAKSVDAPAKPTPKPEPRPEPRPEVKSQPAPKPAPKPEPKPTATPPAKPPAKPVAKPVESTVELQPEFNASLDVISEVESIPLPSKKEDTGERSFVDDEGFVRIGSSSYKALREKESEDNQVKVVREERRKSGSLDAIPYQRKESVSESILEDVFLEIQSIHEDNMAMEDVVSFVMDMAMEKIPCESGAILFAEVNGQELYFATARGPKSKEIMDFRVPMGQGIAGFCAREGVSLAINDAEKDRRFHASISKSLNYQVTSLVCVPIEYEGRVYGCIELLNRTNGTAFSSNEVNALNYMGNQFAQYVNRLVMAREKL